MQLIDSVDYDIKEKNIKEYIEEELKKFNFNKETEAYKYLEETVFEILYNNKIKFELENDIYIKVARINQKNPIQIKWSIDKMIDVMCINTDYNIIKEYFDFNEYKKPTTKVFIKHIVENFENIITNKKYEKEQKQIEVDIMKQIELLKYNKSYRGTKYLIQSIKLIMENENMDLNNLKKDVYSVIATTNHTTIHNVKNNINKATEQMYYECSHKVLKEYFGFVEDIKPTVKTVIFTIIAKTKKEQRKRKKQ